MTLPAAAPALHPAKSERNTSGGFLPTRVIEVELTKPLPKLAPDGNSVNMLTSQRLTDKGGGPTFYSCLVQVEKIGD